MVKKKIKLNKQEEDDCWRVSLANYLGIPAKEVPNFVKEYPTDWFKVTRDWLKKNKKKSIIYVPVVAMEDMASYNQLPYPDGKCIVQVGYNFNSKSSHAILMENGKLMQAHLIEKYDKVFGYFIIYDL